MAETETPQTAAQGGQQTAQSTQQAQSPEWQQKFPGGPDELWKAYTALQGKYDRDLETHNKNKAAQSQQQQPQPKQEQGKWDFSPLSQGFPSLAHRIDIEAAKGDFSPEVSAVFEAMGADPAFFKDAVQYRQQKRFEPLKQYIEGDHNQIMQTVAANIDEPRLQAFQSLIDAGEYEAAAAVVKGVLSKAQAKGAEPKVGQVSANPGGGYKDFKELYSAMKDKRFEWDRQYQEEVRRRFDATPQAVKDEWNKQYGAR